MKDYESTEIAYKNGYAQGLKDAVKHGKILCGVAIEKECCCGYKKRKGLVLQKYTCSVCLEEIDGDSKFCKECGAKLDLEG